ncbi:MAG: class I adenylate-forming enzyme family protein [Gammaproteobacteria bacterium]|nr:class I adenylate-forming enzyme family protein [Gammaproteobacteria bacterium]
MFIPNCITDFLRHAVDQFPDKEAIITATEKLTWYEIQERSDDLACMLLSQNIRRGDRVILCLDNCVETVLLFWAILKIKAVASIIHPSTPVARLNWILQDAGATALFIRNTENQIIAYFRDNVDKHIIVPTTQTFLLKNLLRDSDKKLSYPNGLDLDLACIIYTSGSTGMPKGVMLTQHNMFAAASSISNYLHYQTSDVIISALPLSFDYGLYQIILSTIVGATVILEKDFTWPLQFLKKISTLQATIFPAVATQLAILANHQDRIEQSFESIRMLTNTGAALFPQQIRFASTLFPNAKIFSMYGLTECKRCTYLPPEELFQKTDSVGKAIPNTEIWIVDEFGTKLPPYQEGQLVVRGSTVMRGYWNNISETNKALREGPFPGEKVLYTGDYGYLDEQGYFYFRGRRDDTIKRYSEKVNLKSIEEVIRLFPGLREVHVIDYPNETTGADIVAFVVSEGGHVSIDQMFLHCKSILPRSHWPSIIHLLAELPRSVNGKYDKAALRVMYEKLCASGAA